MDRGTVPTCWWESGRGVPDTVERKNSAGESLGMDFNSFTSHVTFRKSLNSSKAQSSNLKQSWCLYNTIGDNDVRQHMQNV